MKRFLPLPIRARLARCRQLFSFAAAEQRRTIAQNERTLVEGFRALTEAAGRGEVERFEVRARGAELVLTDGRRFGFNPEDRLQRLYSLAVTGEFERKETEWVRRNVRPGFRCVDAGGSFGWYAVLLAQLTGEGGEVHVFEPIPRTADVLEQNLRRNRCANAQVHRLALADSSGSLDLFVPDIGVSGSLRLHDYKNDYEVFRCPVRTLDEIAAEQNWDRLDFIKADIEGAEWALLRGATTSLDRWRPLLLLEVQPESTRRFGHEPYEVFQWLKKKAYAGFYLRTDGSIQRCEGAEQPLPDYNFIFIPTERGVELNVRTSPR